MAGSPSQAFCPTESGQDVAVTTTAAAVALGNGTQVRIYNKSAAAIDVRFGGSTVTAIDGDLGMPAGGVEVFTRPDGATHVSLRANSGGGGDVQVTTGNGE